MCVACVLVDQLEDYARLVSIGEPDFIEVKAVTYCGKSDGSTLTMANVPGHAEVGDTLPLEGTSSACATRACVCVVATVLVNAVSRGLTVVDDFGWCLSLGICIRAPRCARSVRRCALPLAAPTASLLSTRTRAAF